MKISLTCLIIRHISWFNSRSPVKNRRSFFHPPSLSLPLESVQFHKGGKINLSRFFSRRILQFGAGVLISGILLGAISGCSPTGSSAQEPLSTRSETIVESTNKQKIGEPRVTRQVLLQIESGAMIEPQVIVQAEDGGFIIAGSITAKRQGWAAKTDAEGKVLWHYFRDLQEEDKEAFKKPQIPGRPIFTGAVAMPDGSICLCGNMPAGSPPGTPSAFITHLDTNGHLISEEFFIPEKGNNRGVKPRFTGCVRWGDGFAIVGQTIGPYVQTSTKQVAPSIAERWFWVLMFDSIGEKKWEECIPISLRVRIGLLVNISQFPHIANSNLMISANDFDDTEIFSVNMKGEIVAKNMIKGAYQFVRPVVPDGILQISGRRPRAASRNNSETDKNVVITLDEQLNEIHSTPEGLEDFSGYEFRMPDQSIVSIGTQKHTFGQRYTPRAVHVDQRLQNERYVELPHARRPFGYAGSRAANSTRNVNEFVVIKELRVVTEGKVPDDIPPDFKQGAELDFIQIQ
jgi:hypothetical protein